MKFPSSFTLSFLLLAFITISNGHDVRDIGGEQLSSNSTFYITSATLTNGTRWPLGGGGVSLGKTRDLKCPVTILQSYKNDDVGMPVKITILDISLGMVTTDAPLDIDFKQNPLVPKCAESSKWVVYVDNITKKAFVGIGGPKNYPGKQIMNGTFGIRDYEKNYKLVFCFNGSSNCSDIGRFDNLEAGRRLNIANNEPFEVVFQKLPF